MNTTITTSPPGAGSAPGSAPTASTPVGRRAALALLVSAQFVVMLDTSIVNVALPSIQRDLTLSPVGVAWVVNAYFLTFGGFLLLSGRAADALGRRRMFMLGAGLVTAATMLAGLAPTESVLIAARVLQGLGAAVLSPAAMSILLVLFPGGQRAKAMSAWGAASTLGGATGVLAGGLVTGWLGWSWVFFLTVPVTLVALVLAPALFEGFAPARARRSFDALGAAAVTGAALALMWATLAVPDHGWLSAHTVIGVVLAGVLLRCFVAAEKAATDPLVPLHLFRARAVSAGVALGLLGGAARASTFFLVALYLQQGLVLEPRAAGLAMVPTSLAGFAVSVLALPRVLRALGPERSMILGLLVLGMGHLWLARTPVDAGYALDVLPGLLLAAAGVALSFTPTTMVIASGVPAEQSGLASGLANASTQVGAALGISIFTAVAAAAVRASEAPEGLTATSAGFGAAFTAAAAVSLTTALLAAGLLRRPHRSRPVTSSSR